MSVERIRGLGNIVTPDSGQFHVSYALEVNPISVLA